MEEGQIVLTTLPPDKKNKLRPALVLRKHPKYNDFIVCGISSKLHQFIPDLDVIIDKTYVHFSKTGLKKHAVIRSLFLAIVAQDEIAGVIGEIDKATHQLVLKNIAAFLLAKE